MIEAETVDALSANKLLEAIEPLYPMLALIHVFRDNARYHHPPDHSPGVVWDWLAQPGRKAVLLMSEAILVRDRGELPNDHPVILPAHERSASNALDARRAVE
jgi:hypothetical protein